MTTIPVRSGAGRGQGSEFVLKNEFNEDVKNKNNFDFKFGIIEENNLMKDKIFSLNMDKNLEKVKIYNNIFLNKDFTIT